MKILFAVSGFPKLSETFILNQAVGLTERGHEIYFYAADDPEEEIKHDVLDEYDFLNRTSYSDLPDSKASRALKAPQVVIDNIDRPGTLGESLKFWKYGTRSLSLRLLYQFSGFPEEVDFDVVHAHFGPNGEKLLRMREAGLFDCPVITSFYGSDASAHLERSDSMYHKVFRKSERITILSSHMKERLVEYGAPGEKIHKIPLCIDTDKFKPKTTDNKLLKILTVARFTEKKGLKYAVGALSRIDRDFEYHLVGDGDLREDIEKQVEKRGLDDKVVFHGWMSNKEVKEKMQASDIFLLPSVTASDGDQEGTPTVLLEAQAAGLPVASTYHAGIPEIVEDRERGLLSEERDIEGLSGSLRRLLDGDSLRRKFGKEGRSYIENNHSVREVSERLERLYRL